MVYDLIYKFYEETTNTSFPDERGMINALAVFLKQNLPDERKVVLVTKHKFGAWWIENVQTDNAVYHFKDYDDWLGNRTEAEGAEAIREIIEQMKAG